MPKVSISTLDTLSNESSALAALNANFSAIATAIENTLSRDGTSPNTMSANIDLNNYRLVHLPLPTQASEPARLTDINSALVNYQLIATDAEEFSGVAEAAAVSAQGFATTASAAATTATTQAGLASGYATAASNSATSANNAVALGTGIQYTFSSSTTASDPGTGVFRFNSATYASVTSIFIDNTEKNGSSVISWLDTFDDSTTTNKGTLIFKGITTGSDYAIFKVTAITDSTGYRTITVTHVSSNGTFSGDYGVTFYATGDKGSTGAGSGDMVAANNLSDVASASTARSNLGLGTMATQASSNVSISGGAVTGITDITVADGGTGSSTASGARTNLGLVIGTDVLAYSTTTAFTRTLLDDTDAATARTTLGLVTVASSGLFSDISSKPTTLAGYGITDAETLGTVRGLQTQTSSYTAILTDAGKVVEINNASANTFTIPPNSSVAFPIGTYINVVQYGAGQTTITAGVGVTIRSRSGLKTAGQYATASIYKRSTDEWVLGGDLTS